MKVKISLFMFPSTILVNPDISVFKYSSNRNINYGKADSKVLMTNLEEIFVSSVLNPAFLVEWLKASCLPSQRPSNS